MFVCACLCARVCVLACTRVCVIACAGVCVCVSCARVIMRVRAEGLACIGARARARVCVCVRKDGRVLSRYLNPVVVDHDCLLQDKNNN